MGQAVVEQYPVATQATDADQAVIAEFAPGHLRLCGQRMVTAASEHERFLNQWGEVDLRALTAEHVDAEIGLTTQYRLQPFMGTQIEDADADLRILQVEFADHSRQEVERRRGDAGQGHLA